MALFGRSFAMQPQATVPDVAGFKPQVPLPGPTRVSRRRGLFGDAFSAERFPETLQTIGATMRQIGGEQGVLDQRLAGLREQEQMMRERAWEDEQRGRQRNIWSAQDQQRQALQAWVAQQPAEIQRMAQVDPQAVFELYLKQQTPGEWQASAGFTNAFRLRPDGTPEIGGALPLRPYAPRSGGAVAGVPEGFVLDE